MMKKLKLSIIAALIPLWLCGQSYESNKLNGIWQYIQESNKNGQVQRLPVWKVMNTDFTFRTFIIANSDAYSVITNTGTYDVLSDSVFVEHIVGSITDKNLIGKNNYISYQFEGNDTLNISYRLPGACENGKESWVRVKLEYPQ